MEYVERAQRVCEVQAQKLQALVACGKAGSRQLYNVQSLVSVRAR